VLQTAFNALVAYGWNDRVIALFEGLASAGDEPARVVRVERTRSVIFRNDGRDHDAHSASTPAVGDWVAVRDDAISQILPRWSAVTRKDPDGTAVQILAANVDLVIITAPGDRLSAARVERELTIAWDSGARPLVVLTKADLAPSNAESDLRSRLVGIDIVATSTVTGVGVAAVAEALLPDRTAVLLGPSGAGKSTLANALTGSDRLATGNVRDGDHRGRHTTTSRQLVVVPRGGVLIDTPGLRAIGLPGGSDAIGQVFPEIDELAASCRFSDCRHETEPGCAVVAALSDGRLAKGRLESFRKLQREVEVQDRQGDPLVHRAEFRSWKARIKSAKVAARRRPPED